MSYKTIIAGGRDYILYTADYELLDSFKDQIKEVVCGGARGADQGGKRWAELRGILVKDFPADWITHGKAAGPIRNSEMADYAEALILFPGGKGSMDMLKKAKAKGLKILYSAIEL